MNEKAKKYLEICQDESTENVDGYLELLRAVLTGVSSEVSTEDAAVPKNETLAEHREHCEAEKGECPFEIRADRTDAELTREAYAKAQSERTGRNQTGVMRAEYPRKELQEAILDTGMNVNQFSIANGINSQSVYGLLSGFFSPVTADGKHWTAQAQRVAAVLERTPGELFPNEAKLIKTPVDIGRADNSIGQSPLDNAEHSDVATLVKRLLTTLTDRERQVLEFRFGINGRPLLTVAEAANVFGVTPERIRKVENKALQKLRRPERIRALIDDQKRDNTSAEQPIENMAANQQGQRQPDKSQAEVSSDVSGNEVPGSGISPKDRPFRRAHYDRRGFSDAEIISAEKDPVKLVNKDPETLKGLELLRWRYLNGQYVPYDEFSPYCIPEGQQMEYFLMARASKATREIGGNTFLRDALYGFTNDCRNADSIPDVYAKYFGEYGFPVGFLAFKRHRFGVNVAPRRPDETPIAAKCGWKSFRAVSGIDISLADYLKSDIV